MSATLETEADPTFATSMTAGQWHGLRCGERRTLFCGAPARELRSPHHALDENDRFVLLRRGVSAPTLRAMTSDETLCLEIAVALDGPSQRWHRPFPADCTDLIEHVRSCGTKAGHLLGTGVRTFAVPAGDPRSVTVLVARVDSFEEGEHTARARMLAQVWSALCHVEELSN